MSQVAGPMKMSSGEPMPHHQPLHSWAGGDVLGVDAGSGRLCPTT